jgi:RNA polymerase sigma-70 factor (ECF subfamily)
VDSSSVAGHADSAAAEDDALARAAAEQPVRFDAIYERHRASVYRYLRSRTTSDDEAIDLAAETFERALGSISRFRASGAGMAAWLIRIARNAHLDALRRGARHPTSTDTDRHGGVHPGHEDDVVLRHLVEALPEAQRSCIQLRYAAGLTAREIGSVLGMSEAAAQKHLERGLRALREAFHDD